MRIVKFEMTSPTQLHIWSTWFHIQFFNTNLILYLFCYSKTTDNVDKVLDEVRIRGGTIQFKMLMSIRVMFTYYSRVHADDHVHRWLLPCKWVQNVLKEKCACCGFQTDLFEGVGTGWDRRVESEPHNFGCCPPWRVRALFVAHQAGKMKRLPVVRATCRDAAMHDLVFTRSHSSRLAFGHRMHRWALLGVEDYLACYF